MAPFDSCWWMLRLRVWHEVRGSAWSLLEAKLHRCHAGCKYRPPVPVFDLEQIARFILIAILILVLIAILSSVG